MRNVKEHEKNVYGSYFVTKFITDTNRNGKPRAHVWFSDGKTCIFTGSEIVGRIHVGYEFLYTAGPLAAPIYPDGGEEIRDKID